MRRRIGSARQVLMLFATSSAVAAVAGIFAIALGVLVAVPHWFAHAVGGLLVLSLLCGATALYLSDEPLRARGGGPAAKRSDPLWHRIKSVALLGVGAIALLVCTMLLLTA